MASIAQLFANATGWHRRAAEYLMDVEAEIGSLEAAGSGTEADTEIRRSVARLHSLAQSGLPGWLGQRLDDSLLEAPLGVQATADSPMYLRIGDASPVEDSVFWAVAPFIGVGHLAIDADARDPGVTGWLRGILLRALAALPEAALRVLPVDGATLGAAFHPFRPLVDAEAWQAPVTDVDGLRAVLAEAEEQISQVLAATKTDPSVLLVAVSAFPSGTGRAEWARLAAIAHAGPAARVHLLLAGYPPPTVHGQAAPSLDHTTHLRASGKGWYRMSEPAGPYRVSGDGSGLSAPVRLDPGPGEDLIAEVCRRTARTAAVARHTDFTSLMPEEIWRESSAHGLRTVVGREGRLPYELVLDDATPHMQLGGRSGAGKTNVLLLLLYGLASRYSPDELGLYLLDFKEGVSFVEFTPTRTDPSWIPHARTVGIESDREYGLAVLRALMREMNRRAGALKQAGVTKLADLRAIQPEVAMPRLVAVIDEFQVLLAGNDTIARDAAGALDDLARKGRSYGIHMILASQTVAGIEALYTKKDSIFGQFPLRIALPGGSGILDASNMAAEALPVGTAVVNNAGGVTETNRIVRFPHADPASVAAQRRLLWQARPQGAAPPAVFAGYAEHHIEGDPLFATLSPQVRRRQALVGRAVDIAAPTVGFGLDAVPGRHVAVLGTSIIGADILHAAAVGLSRQHDPGSARFVLAGFAAAADPVVDELSATLQAGGHDCVETDAGGLRTLLAQLADEHCRASPEAGSAGVAGAPAAGKPTYLVVFAADVVLPMLAERGENRRTGLDDLRTVLRSGPGRLVHVLSWWRITRRFSDALGGAAGREDVACLVALNVPGNELSALVGDHTLAWRPRANRALLLDRHDHRSQLIVPFVRPGRHDELDGVSG